MYLAFTVVSAETKTILSQLFQSPQLNPMVNSDISSTVLDVLYYNYVSVTCLPLIARDIIGDSSYST